MKANKRKYGKIATEEEPIGVHSRSLAVKTAGGAANEHE
jgi:hypothetical protein